MRSREVGCDYAESGSELRERTFSQLDEFRLRRRVGGSNPSPPTTRRTRSDYGQSQVLGEQLLALAEHGGDRLALRNALTIAGKSQWRRALFGRLGTARGGARHPSTTRAELASRDLDPQLRHRHLARQRQHAGGGGSPLYRDLGDRYFSARALGELATRPCCGVIRNVRRAVCFCLRRAACVQPNRARTVGHSGL
jgi:hypothetical protein